MSEFKHSDDDPAYQPDSKSAAMLNEIRRVGAYQRGEPTGLSFTQKLQARIAALEDEKQAAWDKLLAERETFAELRSAAVLAEREACKQIAAGYEPQHEANETIARQVAKNIAAAIRARPTP